MTRLDQTLAKRQLRDVINLTDNSGGAPTDTIPAATNTDALTHAVGTADDTVDDVGGAFSQTTLNNNFKEITDQLATQRALNIVVIDALASLTAKLNAVLDRQRVH